MKKYSLETMVGVFVVFGLLCVGYMTVKLGKVPLFGDDTFRLYARFSSVPGLRVGSSVEMFGVEVGRVTSLKVEVDRQMALVGMAIDRKMKIYDDAEATIKSAGLIGDKYVRIEPGGAGEPLKPDGIITQTSVPADIEDLIGKYAFGEVSKESVKPMDKPIR